MMPFLLLLLLLQTKPTEARPRFEDLLKAATGPAQLRELEAWCAKEKLAEERKTVQAILAKIPPPAKPAGDGRAREAARSGGDTAREAVTEYREGRTQAAVEDVRKILAVMKERSYAPAELREKVGVLVQGLLAGNEADRKALEAELKGVAHAEAAADELKKSAGLVETPIKALLKRFTTQIFGAVEKCLAANEPGYAFDLYRFLLQVDPDNERAHRALGEARVDGRWLRPFDQEQHRLGLSWDPKWGYIPIKGREKLEAGEIWDPGSKSWGKLADLNKLHAEVSNPWKLPSEHFELSSTADYEVNVKLLARMEAFYLQAFRQYDLFFAGKTPGKSASLIFGMAPTKKRLLVNFYRTEAQFKASANPPTDWAAGFYSGGKHATFFHGGSGRGDFSIGLMQHELTHQILGESSDGGGGPPWLTEGAAVYLQYAEFRGGTLGLGGLKDNGRVAQYRTGLRAGGNKEHSLRAMIELFSESGSWDSGDISKNYRGAGAVVFFLMTFDGGRYRADTIQLLRDAYFAKPRPLEDYFGISLAGLDFLMDRFYKDCEVP